MNRSEDFKLNQVRLQQSKPGRWDEPCGQRFMMSSIGGGRTRFGLKPILSAYHLKFSRATNLMVFSTEKKTFYIKLLNFLCKLKINKSQWKRQRIYVLVVRWDLLTFTVEKKKHSDDDSSNSKIYFFGFRGPSFSLCCQNPGKSGNFSFGEATLTESDLCKTWWSS